jgi:hypothetical protein
VVKGFMSARPVLHEKSAGQRLMFADREAGVTSGNGGLYCNSTGNRSGKAICVSCSLGKTAGDGSIEVMVLRSLIQPVYSNRYSNAAGDTPSRAPV